MNRAEVMRRIRERGECTALDLRGMDLNCLDLIGLDLTNARLCWTALQAAQLRNTVLRGSDLFRASLRGSDLSGSDLREARVVLASFDRATLRGAQLPPPREMLLANWGELSDELTADLMRYDAANHPDPGAFDRWAAGGPCPYAGGEIDRAAHFWERRYLWSPGPSRPAYDLMVDVIRQCCVDSDFHDHSEEGTS